MVKIARSQGSSAYRGLKGVRPRHGSARGRHAGLAQAARARGRSRRFFLPRNTQHMDSVPAVSDWLAGLVALAAAVSWSLIAALLAR